MEKTFNSTLLASALVPVVSHAFGSTETWVSGITQGTAEYTISVKGSHSFTLPATATVIDLKCLCSLMSPGDGSAPTIISASW
jgi:hypothetical protein